MLYQLVCPICRFLKRRPYLLRWGIPSLVVRAIARLVYAKIYQNWDTEARSAVATAPFTAMVPAPAPTARFRKNTF